MVYTRVFKPLTKYMPRGKSIHLRISAGLGYTEETYCVYSKIETDSIAIPRKETIFQVTKEPLMPDPKPLYFFSFSTYSFRYKSKYGKYSFVINQKCS